MVVAPADHWVMETKAFARTMRRAIEVARRGDALVTIGIRPTHAHPGLGYLRAGASLNGRASAPVWRLAQFIEKPTRARARRLLARGRTFWNSGYFIGTADKFLECVSEWLPEHTRQLVPLAPAMAGRRPGLAAGLGRGALSQRAQRAYRALRSVSFDHGVMDHVHDGLVVEGRFRWADLGSWDVWVRHEPSRSPRLLLGSRNVRVIGESSHLVAAVGVRDLLVVHTPRATLICRAGRTEAVRDVVARLQRSPRLARFR
jgi:mannose-1-phosphate guanylyltransferase